MRKYIRPALTVYIVLMFVTLSAMHLVANYRLEPMSTNMSMSLALNGLLLGVLYGENWKWRIVNAFVCSQGFTYTTWAVYSLNAYRFVHG